MSKRGMEGNGGEGRDEDKISVKGPKEVRKGKKKKEKRTKPSTPNFSVELVSVGTVVVIPSPIPFGIPRQIARKDINAMIANRLDRSSRSKNHALLAAHLSISPTRTKERISRKRVSSQWA